MANQDKELLAFNRGVISKIGLARIDLDRMALSAEVQRNFVPRVLGSMMLRPGLKYVDNTDNDLVARNLPFIFEQDETALLEMGIAQMRVRLPDPITGEMTLITRPDVDTVVGNEFFTIVLGDWSDISDVGGDVLSLGTGFISLRGDGIDFGRIEQEITVAVADQGVEHALRIEVEDGPVRFKVGTASELDDILSERRLERGEHSLSFVPTGNFWITFDNEREYYATLTRCSIELPGVMELPTPYSVDSLPFLRWEQSGDVIYVACQGNNNVGNPLQKILRQDTGRSWSVVAYFPENGPFKIQNVGGTTITPSALFGNVTLTASDPIFKQAHATNRSLFRIASQGQVVTQSISGEDQWAEVIRVVGNESARDIGIIIEIIGAGTATFTLQFAFSPDGPWNDTGQTYGSGGPTNTSYNDGQDGQIIYYRLGIKTGDYTSGNFNATLTYTGGSIDGIARIYAFTSPTEVLAQVLQRFGSIEPSTDWWEGSWSDKEGWPTAVAIHEGRLWWAGRDRIYGSESDLYESFDDNVEGDAGPIQRQIGFGPIRVINWLASLGRLMLGTSDTSANVGLAKMDGNHPLGARSNSFDEPLTPTNFNIKTISSRGVFVDRTRQRLYELVYDIDQQDYKSLDLSVFAPDYNEVGIKQLAVQMKPDIRVHCVRNDGTIGMLVYDRVENVISWCEIESDGASGEIEDVAVLPGVVEDRVFYIVKRTINGSTQRHICEWALESDARGNAINRMADSFIEYAGPATTTPFTTELLPLAGEEVEIWGTVDGVGTYLGTDTVTLTGALTNPLDSAATQVTVGLGYTGRYRSARTAEIEGFGLMERTKIHRIGFIAKWMHHLGLRYGPDFDKLRSLPQVENGKTVATDTVWEDYDEDDIAFGGDWSPDTRICLEARAPLPVTLLAAIAQMESVERR